MLSLVTDQMDTSISRATTENSSDIPQWNIKPESSWHKESVLTTNSSPLQSSWIKWLHWWTPSVKQQGPKTKKFNYQNSHGIHQEEVKGNWAGDCGQPETIHNLLNGLRSLIMQPKCNYIVTWDSSICGGRILGLNVIRTKGFLILENRS